MKRGHLVHRGTRGRTIAWARIPSLSDGRVTSVQYRLFLRLSTTGATVSELHVFDMETLASAATGGRKCIADHLRGMRAQLKWRRDQLDFQHLGLEDPTPAPLARPVDVVPGHYSFRCDGGVRQDPPMLARGDA